MKFQPGEKYLYSNTGYSVLALIIEKVTNKDFEEVVSDLFFKPNGLNIGLRLPDFKQTQLAINYKHERSYGTSYFKAKDMKDNFWVLKGNGSFFASAEEMYKWYKTLHNDASVSPLLRSELFSPHFKREDNLFYGYGWHVRTDNDGKVKQVSHAGSDDIMSCYWMEIPQDDIWIYIASNNSDFKATSVTLEILKIIRNSSH